MTLANALTSARLLLLAPLVWAVLAQRAGPALALFLLGVATDVLDGWVARRERPTLLGQLLDPLADKLFYGGVFAALYGAGRLPLLGLVLYALPQLGLGVGALVLWRRRGELRARGPGKAAAGLTALAAGLLLLTPQALPAFWAAVAAQFGAASYYLALQARGRTPPAGGPRTPATPRP
ncbi:MAG: CDP-alcohol phosphatidyltransferase family protein [Candidatus Bipolaricaulaceae bacterium]